MAETGAIVLRDITQADRKRFATCYKHLNNKRGVDWEMATSAWSSKMQVDSFKTVTSRILKALEHGDLQKTDDTQMDRLAMCYLHATDKSDVDWPSAAKEFDAKVKTAFFRTVVQRALKKLGIAVLGKKKAGAAGQKRKADEAEQSESEKQANVPKTKARKKLRTTGKTKAAKVEEGSDEQHPTASSEKTVSEEPVYEDDFLFDV